MTQAIYAIGDIHGQFDDLRRQHDLIAQDQLNAGIATATVVHTGDLIDRGADSNKVVEYLFTGQKNGAPWVILKGNHDRLFSLFLKDPLAKDPWLINSEISFLHPRAGGLSTLQSYGVDISLDHDIHRLHREALVHVPTAHQKFLDSLPIFHQIDRHFFVHAGIRPGVTLANQHEDDMLWIRQEFHQHTEPYSHLIIHGHTVVETATHYGNRVNIDTGAGYGQPMTTIVIDGGDVFVLTDQGRRHLRPHA